jgi:hypothetical protein
VLTEAGPGALEQSGVRFAIEAASQDTFDQAVDAVPDVVSNLLNTHPAKAEIGEHAIAGLVQVGKRVDQRAVEIERHRRNGYRKIQSQKALAAKTLRGYRRSADCG